MPLQQAYAFLFVALEEGRSVEEYAKRAGITQPVMTLRERARSALVVKTVRRLVPGAQAGLPVALQIVQPDRRVNRFELAFCPTSKTLELAYEFIPK
jgi:hypothetical protein